MSFTNIENAPGSQLPYLGVAQFDFTPLPNSESNIISMVQNLGANVMRFEVPWSSTELSPGVYAVDPYTDGLIASCRASGVKVVLCLDYGNVLYTGSASNPPTNSTQYTAFANYAGYVASKYVGNDVWFEIYNEPNNPGFWANSPNASQYAALLAAAWGGIKAKNANAQITTAGIGDVSAQGDGATFMHSVNGDTNLGGFTLQTIHPYSATNPPENLWSFISNYNTTVPYSGTLGATEWGYPSQWISSNETTRQLYVARMLLASICAGLKYMCIYSLHDTGTDPTNEQYTFGLYNYNNTPKLAVTSFQAVMNALEGTQTYSAELIPNGGSNQVYRITLNKANGVVTKIIWTDGPTQNYNLPMNTVTSLVDVSGYQTWFRFLPGTGVSMTLGGTIMPVIVTGT